MTAIPAQQRTGRRHRVVYFLAWLLLAVALSFAYTRYGIRPSVRIPFAMIASAMLLAPLVALVEFVRWAWRRL